MSGLSRLAGVQCTLATRLLPVGSKVLATVERGRSLEGARSISGMSQAHAERLIKRLEARLCAHAEVSLVPHPRSSTSPE